MDAIFSDTTIFRVERLNRESVLDLRNCFRPTETFQFTFYTTCHPAREIVTYVIKTAQQKLVAPSDGTT